MTKKPRSLPLRGAGIVSLAAGAACAGEAAACAIAAASGHHLLHPVFHGMYNPLDGLRLLGTLDARCVLAPKFHLGNIANPQAVRACATPMRTVAALNAPTVVPLAVGVVSFFGCRLAELQVASEKPGGRTLPRVRRNRGVLVIELGKSTGTLYELGHKSGIRKSQRVCLVDKDPYQHLLIVGGTGGGKSVAAINPITRQVFELGCGAFILNVKGDVHLDVQSIAQKAGRSVRVIGIGFEPTNLTAGRTPELLSAYLSSVMLLADSGRDGHLWNTLATNRARAALNLLWFFPEHYTLPAVYRFIFQRGFQEDILARIDRERSEREEALKTERDPVKIDVLETEKRTIETALQEVANADDLDAKIRQSVETQLTSVLSNMMAPEIEDAFFSAGAPALDLSSTYEDGTIFVINAEIKSYGLAAAAILALTKLMFFDAMEARRNAPSANKDRPVAYICDEVQDVLTCSEDGRGDQSFFAKARDTKTMCVLATQNLKGLIAKVGEDMAMTVVASMRTRLAFRTEDDTTIENTLKLLGKTEVERESSSSTKNPGQWAKSKGTSVQTVRERIADEELFRNLDEFQAVLIGSIGNRSADDVITCTPEYVS